jgi:hypothetical protein
MDFLAPFISSFCFLSTTTTTITTEAVTIRKSFTFFLSLSFCRSSIHSQHNGGTHRKNIVVVVLNQPVNKSFFQRSRSSHYQSAFAFFFIFARLLWRKFLSSLSLSKNNFFSPSLSLSHPNTIHLLMWLKMFSYSLTLSLFCSLHVSYNRINVYNTL